MNSIPAVKVQRSRVLIGGLLALVFLLVFAALTKPKPESWNDIARIASIESLVERGTWVIDDSPWVGQTQDKVFLNGRFYSDKMPVLTLMGAGVYSILHNGLGASLAPDCSQAARFCAYPWLTLVLIGLSVALLLWLFFDFAARRGLPLWAALVGTLALGLGSMLFPYALVFNHHAPGAASLFVSFYLLTTRAMADSHWLIPAGLFAALAVTFDILSGIMAVVMLGIAVARFRSQLLYFVAGAMVPVLLTALLDYQIAGTVIPPYMITNGYDYPGSAFPATIAGMGAPDDYPAYAFRMFLGGKGLFAYNPLLLLALVAAIAVAFQRNHPLRAEALLAAAGFIALGAYLATNTGNYGGTGYGERWFVISLPILFVFLLEVPPLRATSLANAAWLVFLPLLGVSILSSLQGAQAPWQDWLPPLQMTRSNQFPVFGFKWNFK